MASTTLWSEGVPPKAGTGPVGGAAPASPVGSSVAGSSVRDEAAVARG